jgi:hypothetical protein
MASWKEERYTGRQIVLLLVVGGRGSWVGKGVVGWGLGGWRGLKPYDPPYLTPGMAYIEP